MRFDYDQTVQPTSQNNRDISDNLCQQDPQIGFDVHPYGNLYSLKTIVKIVEQAIPGPLA